jgi:hypothetical protein
MNHSIDAILANMWRNFKVEPDFMYINVYTYRRLKLQLPGILKRLKKPRMVKVEKFKRVEPLVEPSKAQMRLHHWRYQ